MSGEPLLEGVGPLQPLAKALAGPVMRPWFRLRVEGAEHLPREGPAILAPNHDSMWDIPVLVVACPRPVVFMAMEDVFDRPLKRWVFRRLGGFPVSSGGSDLSAMKTSLAVLRSGRLLCIYPEGTRRPGTLLPFHPGVARIAMAAAAPIVPVGIVGTADIWSRGRAVPRRAQLTVRYGEPIAVDASRRPRAETVDVLSARVRSAVETLLRA